MNEPWEGRTSVEQQRTSTQPIACDLTAIDADKRDRHRALWEQIQTKTLQIEELPDGYAFRFPSDSALYLEVAEFITLERLCCPFLSFNLELAAGDGPIWLRLTGGAEAKQVLRAELGLA